MELRRKTHKTIAAVTDDYEAFKYNTALAKLMELSNLSSAQLQDGHRGPATTEALAAIAVMLSPIAPHVAEELWQRLGKEGFVARATWPTYDPALLVDDTKEIPVQVNGKLRDTLALPVGTSQADAETAARGLANVARHLEEGEVQKVVWVPDRLLNFVVR